MPKELHDMSNIFLLNAPKCSTELCMFYHARARLSCCGETARRSVQHFKHSYAQNQIGQGRANNLCNIDIDFFFCFPELSFTKTLKLATKSCVNLMSNL